MESGRGQHACRQDYGPDRAAGALSLSRYELDQVSRVTALRRPALSVFQLLVGTLQVKAQRLRTGNRFANRVGPRGIRTRELNG